MNLLVRNVGWLVTNGPDVPGELGVVEDAAVAIRDGVVAWVGPDADTPVALLGLPEVDAGGRAALPGFVDSHTHLVFAGDRSDEFVARLGGASYEDLLAMGGGIHSTVAATRAVASRPG